jgi:hypothetical protein
MMAEILAVGFGESGDGTKIPLNALHYLLLW